VILIPITGCCLRDGGRATSRTHWLYIYTLLSVCGRCSFGGLGSCVCRVCVCVSVSGALFSVGVCVCDLLIFLLIYLYILLPLRISGWCKRGASPLASQSRSPYHTPNHNTTTTITTHRMLFVWRRSLSIWKSFTLSMYICILPLIPPKSWTIHRYLYILLLTGDEDRRPTKTESWGRNTGGRTNT